MLFDLHGNFLCKGNYGSIKFLQEVQYILCLFLQKVHQQPKVPLNKKLTYVVLIVTLNSSHVNTLLY